MDRKTPRPTPLRLVQPTESRRYLILDAHSSLPSPAYPFERQPVLQEGRSPWQLLHSPPLVQAHPRVVLSKTVNRHWNDPVDSRPNRDSFHSSRSYRSLAPPISPPALSPRGRDTEHSYKRHGRTLALVPAEVNREHVFTHVAVSAQDSDNTPKEQFSHSSIPPEEDGLSGDMQDMLRRLDDLASCVKAASSTRDCISNVTSTVRASRLTGYTETEPQYPRQGLSSDKGKNRLLPTSPLCGVCSVPRDLVESSGCAGDPTIMSPVTDGQSEGFIYMPSCDTPEFLVGSSSSPIAYPVCGYSSHSSRCSPHGLDPTHNIPYHRHFLERRSAPCPSPIPSLISPPLGKTSFKTLFQRSGCNTTTASRPSIPSGHVPIENTLRRGKRMRLPWLRI